MSAGAPDFFFREAKRLNYVARSAFKVCLFTPLHFVDFLLGKKETCLMFLKFEMFLGFRVCGARNGSHMMLLAPE